MTLVRFDRDVLATWAKHGIPADASTLEYAQRLILKMFAEIETLEAAYVEALDALARVPSVDGAA
jgi:hypothetical protein